jgi:hypothetical protein
VASKFEGKLASKSIFYPFFFYQKLQIDHKNFLKQPTNSNIMKSLKKNKYQLIYLFSTHTHIYIYIHIIEVLPWPLLNIGLGCLGTPPTSLFSSNQESLPLFFLLRNLRSHLHAEFFKHANEKMPLILAGLTASIVRSGLTHQ